MRVTFQKNFSKVTNLYAVNKHKEDACCFLNWIDLSIIHDRLANKHHNANQLSFKIGTLKFTTWKYADLHILTH